MDLSLIAVFFTVLGVLRWHTRGNRTMNSTKEELRVDKNVYVLLNTKTQEIFDSCDVRFMKWTEKFQLEKSKVQLVNTLFGNDFFDSEREANENNLQKEQERQEQIFLYQPLENHKKENVHIHDPGSEQISNTEIEISHDEQKIKRVETEKWNVIYLIDRQQQDYLTKHPGVQLLPTGKRPMIDISTKERPATAKKCRISYVSPMNEISDKLSNGQRVPFTPTECPGD